MHLKFVVSGKDRTTETRYAGEARGERQQAAQGKGFLSTFRVTAQRPKKHAILWGNPPSVCACASACSCLGKSLSVVCASRTSAPKRIGLSSDCGRNLWQ